MTIDFDSFFNCVFEITDNIKLKKALQTNNQKANILYLTNQCNIDCDYCYQKAERPIKYTALKRDIDNFFKELCEREPDKISTVVIFGGEPTLERDLIYYIFDKTDEITENTGKKFALSMTTNGLAFLCKDYYNNFITRTRTLKNKFTLEISYDGIGHDRRTYKNGSSTRADVEKVLELFPRCAIRYTIHKFNYENALKDITSLCLKHDKVVVNFYEKELEDFVNIKEFKAELKRKFEYIFTRLKIPVCHLACRACLGCNYKEFNAINYNGEFEVNGNAGDFNHFSKLKELQIHQSNE